jgi:hypothetical protein
MPPGLWWGRSGRQRKACLGGFTMNRDDSATGISVPELIDLCRIVMEEEVKEKYGRSLVRACLKLNGVVSLNLATIYMILGPSSHQ